MIRDRVKAKRRAYPRHREGYAKLFVSEAALRTMTPQDKVEARALREHPELGRKWHSNGLKSLVSRKEMAPGMGSLGQFDGATHKSAWIRALPDVDFKTPRLQNAIEAVADE